MAQRSLPPGGTDVLREPLIESIASTKLQPPRSARRLIPREALAARLLEARRQRCVVVQGPAGSGKTSTLAAWRQALLGLDFDVAWLTLATEDDELARFFDCLLASLAEVDPAIGRETALLMGRGSSDESAVEHWVITLVQGIASRPRELVLILDDVQHLEDPRIFQALQWLLEYAPPNLHLALGSRNALSLSLSRLRAQGLLSEFDLRDLRFSAQESERFLREQIGSIDARDARVLHELTDGWVAGLQLFALDLKTKSGGGYARVKVRDAQAFASYFEHEVLAHLAPDDLELLTRMAACNRFCASLCATLMDQPLAVAGMAARLGRLEADNLFISQVSGHDRESWYRLHPLLREVLLARRAGLPEPEQHALHHAAWRWFEAHGHVDEAVRHAVQAGEMQAAADLVEGCAPDLLERGELTQLANLMRRLPEEQLRARFNLRLAKACLDLYADNLQAVDQGLGQLEAQAQAQGRPLDAQQRHGITVLRGGAALLRDDSDAVHAMRGELQAIADDAETSAFVGRSHVLAWMHMCEGEHEKAGVLLAESMRRNVSSRRALMGRCLEGLGCLLQGNMGEGEGILRAALQTAETGPAVNMGVACVAAGLLGDALYEFNELEAVCRLLEPRSELLERASFPDSVLRALNALSCAHWLRGQRLEALEHLARLEDYALRHDLGRPLAYALALRLRWHLHEGETAQAEEALGRITALGARHAGARRGTAGEIVRVAEWAGAEMCMHWNDFGAAIARLEPLADNARAAGRWRNVALVQMQLAAAHQGLGHAAAAQRHLLDALRLGHRLGLIRSLLDASPRVPALLQALLEDKVLDPVLAFYAQRLLAASAHTRRQSRRLAGEGGRAPAIDAFSEREREVLGLVAQAMPNKKIARVLGVTPHTVKWHLRKIYAKLGVAERDEAVARMRDLEAGKDAPKAR